MENLFRNLNIYKPIETNSTKKIHYSKSECVYFCLYLIATMISLDAITITLKWHSEWFHNEIAIAATKESCEILNAEIRAVKMTSSLYYVISIFVAIPRKIFTPSFWKWKFPKLNNKSLMMSTTPHTEIISMLIRRIALHSITSQLPLFEPTYTLYLVGMSARR